MSYTAEVCGVWADVLSERYKAQPSASKVLQAEAALRTEHFLEAEELARSASETSEGEVKADALRAQVKALIGQGRRAEAEALATAQEGAFQGQAKAKVVLAAVEASLGSNDQIQAAALTKAEDARRAFGAQGAKYMEAKILLAMAALRMERGEIDLVGLEEGLQNVKEARQLAIELHDRRLEAMCLVAMIDCEGWLVSAEDALLMAEEAQELCLEIQDRAMEAYVLCKMAEWNVRLADYSRAISDAEDAMEIYRQMDSPQELQSLRLLLQLLLHLAEVREARQKAMEALQRFQGNKSAQIDISKMLVEVHLRGGNLQEAVSVSKDCIRWCKELDQKATQASLLLKISRGRLDAGDLHKASAVAQDAWEILKDSGASEEKVESMEILYEAKLREAGAEDAASVVEEFRHHFEMSQDVLCLAKASKLLAELQLKMEDFDAAQDHSSKAMEIFRKARRRKEEAETMKLCSQVLWKKAEYKAAARHAEQARDKFRDFDAKEEEVSCLYIVAENAVRHAVLQGAQVQSTEPAPREARTALEKSLKAAEAGLKLLRITSLTKHPELHGELLCAKAQALTFQGRFEAALNCLDEAVLRLRELDDYQLEANALMLAADNLQFLKKPEEAVEDPDGEERAKLMLQRLKQPVARPAEKPGPGPPSDGAVPVWMQGDEASTEVKEQPKAAATGPVSVVPALNVSSVTPEMLMAKVKEVAAAVTGEDDLEVETPLMEAGMTSAGAVQLRDTLGKALPGVNLPFTLAFDYPTLSEMTEMISGSLGVQGAIQN